MNLKHVRETIKYADNLGVAATPEGNQKTHVRLRLRKGEASMLLVLSKSPSCHRAQLNNHILIRKFAAYADTLKGAIA